MDRRNFLAGVSGLLAAAPILPGLNLLNQNYRELDVEEADWRDIIPVKPNPATPQIKEALSTADLRDVLSAVAEIPGDPGFYGFSYSSIFEPVMMNYSSLAEFPLDDLISIFLDSNKQIIRSTFADPHQDYVKLEMAEWVGDDKEISIRPFSKDRNWDSIAAWIQEMQSSFQSKVSYSAWSLLLEAAKTSPALEVTNFIGKIKENIPLMKAAMRRTIGNSSSELMCGHVGPVQNLDRPGFCDLVRPQATDLYVPTHTYLALEQQFKSMVDEMNNMMRPEIDLRQEWDRFRPDNQRMTILGVNICHAPELSWWNKKLHWGVLFDLRHNDYCVQPYYDLPEMITRTIENGKVSGRVWGRLGMGVLDTRKIMLVK